VLLSYINIHFIGRLYRLEKDEQYRIIDKVAKVSGLITNKEALSQSGFLFPVTTSKPIEGLAVPKRGML
jgi:hypothetical protein